MGIKQNPTFGSGDILRSLILIGDDYFVVKAGKNVPVFSYTPSLNNLKFATVASAFTREVGLQQKTFHYPDSPSLNKWIKWKFGK